MGSIVGRIDDILETYGSIDNYYKQIRMNITQEGEQINTKPHIQMPTVLFSARELGKEIKVILEYVDENKDFEDGINSIKYILKKYNVYESK